MARYLVVDDDRLAVSAMTRLLRDDGHEVVGVTAGADAIDALSHGVFDAVVTDLEMPHVDGRAVARFTRERHPDACLVVVTARADEAAPLAGDSPCVLATKPLDYAAVAAAVSHCRARGGPAHGHCHLRSRAREAPSAALRRK